MTTPTTSRAARPTRRTSSGSWGWPPAWVSPAGRSGVGRGTVCWHGNPLERSFDLLSLTRGSVGLNEG